MSVFSYSEGGNVPLFIAPIENDHESDVIVKFALKSRLESSSQCITTVAVARKIGLEHEVRTLTYRETALDGNCGRSIVPGEIKRKPPSAAVNQRIMRIGTDHG